MSRIHQIQEYLRRASKECDEISADQFAQTTTAARLIAAEKARTERADGALDFAQSRLVGTQGDLADAKRMLWAMCSGRWTFVYWVFNPMSAARVCPAQFGEEPTMLYMQAVDTLAQIDFEIPCANGIPEITCELREAVDALPGSPFHDAAKGNKHE